MLKILSVEFTTRVPTLAVTCEGRPRLLVNLDFVSEHCRTDIEVKAVVCHEFLHVLLRHTERLTPSTTAEHLAFDAVINAIVDALSGLGVRDVPMPASPLTVWNAINAAQGGQQ